MGELSFIYDGEDEAESFYIGIGNFAERTGSVPLVYDWRAPVSGLFYDFDQGPASYEAPLGTIEGEIVSKWQYKIRNGRMIYGFESDVKIDDEILKQELGSNGDVQLKNYCADNPKTSRMQLSEIQKTRFSSFREQQEVGKLRWHFTGSHICYTTTESI